MPSAANLFGLDYRAEAARLGPPPVPITDAHTHVGGLEAHKVFDGVRRLFGVARVYSMTPLAQAAAVRDTFGPDLRFIAVPDWNDPDRATAFRAGFLRQIEAFHRDFGSRILKLWASPRFRDLLPDGRVDLWDLDSRWRIEACKLGESLGMMYMVHVADPDTWFATRYADTGKYLTKREHYLPLERMLDRFGAPWIAAHLGGWPEDLDFLDGLLGRHPNLALDTSATKWMVRELSKHPHERLRAFLSRWRGRLLFGSDLVVTDDHLRPAKQTTSPMADLADSPEAAFELYASRYWALRTMWETAYDGPSPIADPDLAMVDPARHTPLDSPRLAGRALPRELLAELYAGAADRVLGAWWEKGRPTGVGVAPAPAR
ncbi:MAG TPA: hypothetical protein VD963_02490 [Phycisphaerales bacterium]|nr:hypothetical protein [Phycisphaerales bacterium]